VTEKRNPTGATQGAASSCKAQLAAASSVIRGRWSKTHVRNSVKVRAEPQRYRRPSSHPAHVRAVEWVLNSTLHLMQIRAQSRPVRTNMARLRIKHAPCVRLSIKSGTGGLGDNTIDFSRSKRRCVNWPWPPTDSSDCARSPPPKTHLWRFDGGVGPWPRFYEHCRIR